MARIAFGMAIFSKSFLSSQFKVRGPEILIVLLALTLRLLLLDLKPPHFDEGVNGWFVDQMAKQGYFKYDPANYHGPLHFYVLFAWLELFGRNLWAMRVPIALVSTGGVALMLCFQRFLGRNVCRLAGLAMAVSPGYVFYGRYAIHESWLVLFLLLTTWGLFALYREGSRAGLWAVALGVTGMILTKETYIIHLACFGLAYGVWRIRNAIRRTKVTPCARQLWQWPDAVKAAVVSGALLVFFYSGNFMLPWFDAKTVNADGSVTVAHQGALTNMVRTFSAWADTGSSGHGHEKTAYDLHLPVKFWYNATEGDATHDATQSISCFKYSWLVLTGHSYNVGIEQVEHSITWFNYYWLALMGRYEWPALLALLGVALAFQRPGSGAMRYLAIYGGGALAAYTIVHYKTPWCIISLLWPLLFLFGYCVEELRKLGHTKLLHTLVALLLLANTAWSARLNFWRPTDEKEPYVYVQTFNDIYKLVNPLLAEARRDPANYHLRGTFLVSSYYPLPWMLGDFDGIAYWGLHDFNGPFDSDFLLVEKERAEEVRKQLKDAYFMEKVKLRASQDECTLFFSYRHFHDYFPRRTPELNPERANLE